MMDFGDAIDPNAPHNRRNHPSQAVAMALSLVAEMADPDLQDASPRLRHAWQKQAIRIAELARRSGNPLDA